EAMRLGQEAAEHVTSKFVNPIKLEFEKVYFPYLLINKKRYAGLYWTKTEKYDKLDTKGLETVRRDNCPLVPLVLDTCLKMLLIDQNVTGAVEYAKSVIADLLQNKIDLSMLVITKQLSKTDYSGKQAHVELAERMRKRDAGSAPQLGDRVPYVIIKGTKNAKAYEKAEDPIFVLDNNLPIDTGHYVEHQLTNPLTRIFEPILGSKVSTLFKGEHTRTIHVAAPTSGAMARFMVKTNTCLSCKTPLRKEDQHKAVCKHCEPKLPEIYVRNTDTMRELEMRYARLWTECQRCQGSVNQEVVCTNRDCPIFYMRKKSQKDTDEQAKVMERFDYTCIRNDGDENAQRYEAIASEEDGDGGNDSDPWSSFESGGPNSLADEGGIGTTILGKARALYDFEAENPTELAFAENDTLYITYKQCDGWLVGYKGNQVGLIPENYVELFDSEST
ncbi:DNA-directed DNA polymerase delta, partial [Coemansia sp. RSA 2052]